MVTRARTVRGRLGTALGAAMLAACTVSASPPDPRVVFHDDFDQENRGVPRAAYTGLRQWEVLAGSVDLEGRYPFEFLPPGNGLYLDLDGSTAHAATIRTRKPITLEPGRYTLSYQVAGCQHVATNDVLHVTLGAVLHQRVELVPYSRLRTYRVSFTVPVRTVSHLRVSQEGGDNFGMLFDNVEIRRQ